ncbi:RagB/SusD family nutrient uptake outer membrane protein [Chitinophaga deserti]|uniref:RagB/SusD family nutrient uptake outer membrane protein n=1 Tax=Chitinophaga deserti TaxID=2164099 RepID=UPI000D6D763D|nr:RagB/SusD family nutrient uptake outer membrane protein [Chitinophaga deserti]
MSIIKKNIYALLAGTVLLASCSKDFLTLEPRQNTEVSVAIKDLQGMRAAVNGLYSALQSANYYGRTASVLPDLQSDNAHISTNYSNRYSNQDTYTTTANDGMASGLWNSLYITVANANLLIEKGTALQLPAADTAEQRSILGQAYALRGLAYFDLARYFCQPYNFTADASHMGAPIVLKTATEKAGIVAPPRSTVKQTYDRIIEDLDSAVSKLNRTTSVSVRAKFNVYAAKALLARVYLYKGEWAKVVPLCTDVLAAGSSRYSLIPASTMLGDFLKQNNPEVILEVANTATDNNSTDWLGYFYDQGGYGDMLSTAGLYNIYSATDARRGFITKGSRSSGENPAYIVGKYTRKFEENVKLIRLAEIYLTRAEAYAQLGESDKAIADANVVIARADSDPAALLDAALTGTPLVEAVLLERRKELAFEGQRLFDLTRYKKDFVKIRRGGNTINVKYPENRTIQPIPQRELDANAGLKGQQNPGYF